MVAPSPKTEVADWYSRTILASLWGFPPERFTSQAFWDCFDRIRSGGDDDELEQAQTRLLGVWKDRQLVSRRLLAYDTTNFHTYVASTNSRMRAAGCEVELEVWPRMPHAWHVWARVMPEARAAIARIGVFVQDKWRVANGE